MCLAKHTLALVPAAAQQAQQQLIKRGGDYPTHEQQTEGDSLPALSRVVNHLKIVLHNEAAHLCGAECKCLQAQIAADVATCSWIIVLLALPVFYRQAQQSLTSPASFPTRIGARQSHSARRSGRRVQTRKTLNPPD